VPQNVEIDGVRNLVKLEAFKVSKACLLHGEHGKWILKAFFIYSKGDGCRTGHPDRAGAVVTYPTTRKDF